jgi:hypothetical protein
LTLKCLQVIRKLAFGISNTGLGSVEDAFLCIIPPLSVTHKLPVDAAVHQVVRSLEGDENVRNWRKCTEAYLKLLSFVNRFPSTSRFFIIRTAVATIVYLRRMTDTRQIYKNTDHGTELTDQLSKLQTSFSKLLRMNPDIKCHLWTTFTLQNRWNDYQPFMDDAEPDKAAKMQNREDLCNHLKDTGHFSHLYEKICRDESCKAARMQIREALCNHLKDTGHFSYLHEKICRDESCKAAKMQIREDLYNHLKDTGHFSHLHEKICRDESCKPAQGHPENNEEDCLGWTPLHYAVLMKNQRNVE